MDNLKQIEDLKKGECKVVTKVNDKEKIWNGVVHDKAGIVFFCIPDIYADNIIGYLQD